MKPFKLLIILFFISSHAFANPPKDFLNPIIPGFHPDPSICQVGDDYYLVTSSFEWFPGIPIFHSKDLVNWEQIGHVLNRPSQLNMVNNRFSSGVWAPTIRYHDGQFHVVVTCKQCGNNIYVTADNAEGPYSDPIYLDTPKGIDPSLFWDDDGRCWFTANRFPEKPEWDSQHIIYVQELDTEKGELIGEPVDLTYGMREGTRATEAPHIYKINGLYYLITAEDMTWEKHMVCMYYSEKVTGPYKQVENNPVLSHRNKPNSPIQHTGHADIIQTPNGDWWAVMLGVRKLNGNYYLGRESFLTPLAFEGIQPVFNPGIGEVLPQDKRPDLPWTPVKESPARDEFDNEKLGLEWTFLRTPQSQWYSIEKGHLNLQLRPTTSKDGGNPSLIARRFQHHQFTATTQMKFTPSADHEVAGLLAIQNENFHYRLELGLKDNTQVVSLYKVFSKKRKEQIETLIAQAPYSTNKIVLRMKVDKMQVEFFYGENEKHLQTLGGTQSCDAFCSNYSGGFIGAFVGMYASSQGKESENKAGFDWFEYVHSDNK